MSKEKESEKRITQTAQFVVSTQNNTAQHDTTQYYTITTRLHLHSVYVG